jgi:hypothetical protein
MFQVFPGHDFPRPVMVLSDRAMVFLVGALEIWNGENMSQFLQRAYRIVTDEATELDYKLTNIHACLAHLSLVSTFLYWFPIIVIFLYRVVKKS